MNKLETKQLDWALFASASADETITDFTFAGKGAAYAIPEYLNRLEIMGDCDANDVTGEVALYLYRTNGDAQLIGTATFAAGTQENADETERFYIDTWAVATKTWPTSIESSDTTGSNSMATLLFDGCGRAWLKAVVTDVNDGDVRLFVSGY